MLWSSPKAINIKLDCVFVAAFIVPGTHIIYSSTHRASNYSKISINFLGSCLLRRTWSVFSPTSQPFSACHCRREYSLLGNLPELLCFLCSPSTAQAAQHSACQPAQAAKQVLADQSTTKQASGQSWLEPACRRGIYLCSSLRCQNERRNRNLPGLQKYTTFHKSSLADVMLHVTCTLLFLSVLSISSMHAASGLFSWTMELLAFASRHFAP